MPDIKELFKESFINRKSFLEKKFNEWKNCKTERGKAKIIVNLIQIEPSHLAEPWILDQVINWMKEHDKNKEYLQEAFISKGDRDILTDRQRVNLAKTTFLDHKVKRLKTEKGCSEQRVIRDIVLNSKNEILTEDPEAAIKQELKRHRKKIGKNSLPWPYYGRDFIIKSDGEGGQYLEIPIKDKPIEFSGHTLFGNTTFQFPIKK
jgi:hypothetical protein